MQALKTKAVLAIFALLTSLGCEAQQVYSQAIYSAGTSYQTLCSLTVPFPPHQYKLTVRSWYEDTNGFVIMDIGREKARGGVLHRSLDIERGLESFTVSLDSAASKQVDSRLSVTGTKGSGDLALLVTQCVTNRGGRVPTNALPVIQAAWIRPSLTTQDLIVVDGDHFAEIKRALEQAYGAPVTGIQSSAQIGYVRSLTYMPQQVGVVLNVTANSMRTNSTHTIVSVLAKQKQ